MLTVTYGLPSTEVAGSSAIRRTANYAKSSSSLPSKPPAARSPELDCTFSTSQRRPKTGPMYSGVPTLALASSTCSTPTSPASPRHRFVQIQPGGQRRFRKKVGHGFRRLVGAIARIGRARSGPTVRTSAALYQGRVVLADAGGTLCRGSCSVPPGAGQEGAGTSGPRHDT